MPSVARGYVTALAFANFRGQRTAAEVAYNHTISRYFSNCGQEIEYGRWRQGLGLILWIQKRPHVVGKQTQR